MRITYAQYAVVLYEATKDKPQKEINGVISNFTKILAKNNQLKLKDKIAERFNAIYNKANGIIETEIISREKLSSELTNKLSGFLKDKYQAKKVVIENKIDEKIKGGVIIKVGDEIMDGSVTKQLSNLKKTLIS